MHLGGGLGLSAGFGRKLRGLRSRAEDLPDYVERVAGRFHEQREGASASPQWVRRADEEDLR